MADPSQPSRQAPAIRASDADRDRVVHLLGEHAAAGRLTLEELSERLEQALGAQTQAELAELLQDLPALDGGPPRVAPASRSREPSNWSVAVMSGSKKRGRWRAESQHTAVAVMGGCEIDLRQAEIVGDELTLTCVAIMGGIDVIVPEGVEVDVGGFSLMGAHDDKVPADVPPLPGSPLIRVRAYAIMGGVTVRARRSKRKAVEVAPPLPPPPPAPPSLPR